MVTSEKPVSGDGDSSLTVSKSEGLPIGNYRIVGWDLDFSGRRLVDEILQIAAYTPEKEFSLYIMPSRDLSQSACRRHNLKVVTIQRYRVLKHLKSNKPIKTKSEISALLDFLTWLEEVRGDAKDGVILVFHEASHSCPALLLHCLGRYPHYNLLERFKAVVAGFASGFVIAESKCAKTVTHFNLRTLSSTLLDYEGSLESAADRARLAYQVLHKLCCEDGTDNAGAGDSGLSSVANLLSCVCEVSKPCAHEEEQLIKQQEMIKRQDALKPVFSPFLKGNRKERDRAHSLRRNLVDANIDLTLITEAWNAGKKEAVGRLLDEKACISHEKDREELLTKIEWHFVPELRPKIERKSFPKRGRKSSKSAEKVDGLAQNLSKDEGVKDVPKDDSEHAAVSPDTTTILTPEKPLNNDFDIEESSAVAC